MLFACALLLHDPEGFAASPLHPTTLACAHVVVLGFLVTQIAGAFHVAAPLALRTRIPEAYTSPWEFRASREEVLYDMHRGAPKGLLLALASRLAQRLSASAELRKWHVLLAGKAPDEQLWAVRPPPGGLTDPLVREWAARTLEHAGYDVGAMLPEWEVFWRRKGVIA